MRVDKELERELIVSGVGERNARKLATEAPYRVTYGFGPFSNHRSRQAAYGEAERIAKDWDDPSLGPHVIKRNSDGSYSEIYRPETMYERNA